MSGGGLSSRRNFLWQAGGGAGASPGLDAAARARSSSAFASSGATSATAEPHFAPRAKRVVQMFMAGAASHLDLFDHKPELEKRHGQPSDFGEKVEAFRTGWGREVAIHFRPYGECGKLLSDAVAPLGACVDEMAFVHNMVGKTGVHSAATYLQATGFQTPGVPGAGCWVSYALGSMNENLPAFVVLPDHRGYASNGPKNWDAAFLPASRQGTAIFPGRENPIADLFPSPGTFASPSADAAGLAVLRQLNQRHAELRDEDSRLEARIRSYELAARMQLAAPEALNLDDEPRHFTSCTGWMTRRLSGQINPAEEAVYFGRKCRRRGDCWAGRAVRADLVGQRQWTLAATGIRTRTFSATISPWPWDGAGAAALILDLKQRGLLDDTLIIWTTEFGRMPSTQGSKGRDHNPTASPTGSAAAFGASQPRLTFGYKPLDPLHPTQVYDIHATMLHLLGLDHRGSPCGTTASTAADRRPRTRDRRHLA